MNPPLHFKQLEFYQGRSGTKKVDLNFRYLYCFAGGKKLPDSLRIGLVGEDKCIGLLKCVLNLACKGRPSRLRG
jgi:hypothetical protein